MGEMAMRPALLLPEALLFFGGLATLMWGSFLPRTRQYRARGLAALALAASGIAAGAALLGSSPVTAFDGTFAVDGATGTARLLVVIGTGLVLGLAADEIAGSPRESETYALLLFAAAGALVMAGANDLLVLVVGFFLASLPLYGLIGLVHTGTGAEAAMKTYLLGALFGIVLMAGVTLLYGVTGATTYADLRSLLGEVSTPVVGVGVLGVVAGLMFKAGGVPAHFWVPDAAQGAWVSVAAFVTTVPKIGALVAAYRLALVVPSGATWPILLGGLAVLSMTLGNLAAYWQDDPRRLLGWSTVSQVGYLLVPVAVAGRSDLALPSLLLYLVAYTVTNVAAFAVTSALPQRRSLRDYQGLARRRPLLAGGLLVVLLGLVGTPPTAVFVAKVAVAGAAWDGGAAWLVVALLANTVVSLFYYLRWIGPVFGTGPDGTAVEGAADSDSTLGATRVGETVTVGVWSHRTAVTAGAASVALGLAAGAVWALLPGALALG